MKFSIDTDELAKGLYRAQGIVEKKTAMPILSNVLFTASKNGKITITATDLEVGMTGEHEADVSKEGSITISARHLYDIIRTLKKQKVTITKLENNWAEISCGKIEYRMLGMAAEEFQDLPDVSQAKMFDVDSGMIRDMIDKTIYAVSTDETRYNLNGSFLEKSGDEGFRMVATDGHRLSMIDSKMAKNPKEAVFDDGVIIPKKGLMEIKRLVESEDVDCQLGLDENNLVFKMSGVTVIMRLLDGQFPEYRQVVPEKQNIILQVDRKLLMESLRRVSILSSDRTLGLKLSLQKGFLRVSTSNPDLGEAREDIEIEYDGKELTIGFNARYLIDALATIETDIIEMSLEDDLSPGVFRPEGDQKYTCVVMPMRI
ncbi:MAG: DNA polymerase III subunit beta [Deltaproteobacteria bacterium]|nr:DNA polymerase III subunit beta [Deltaproteobacteria bacterium]